MSFDDSFSGNRVQSVPVVLPVIGTECSLARLAIEYVHALEPDSDRLIH